MFRSIELKHIWDETSKCFFFHAREINVFVFVATRSEWCLTACHLHTINALKVICPCCLRSYTHLHAEITTIPLPQQNSTVLLLNVCNVFPLPNIDSFQLVSFTTDIV